MRILIAFDGSDDGLEGLRTIADMLHRAGEDHEFTLVVVGWPPRASPIWDRAFEQQLAADDLHRAMAEVVAIELARLRELFAKLGSVTSVYLEGDPTTEIPALIDSTDARLAILGLTRGKRAASVNAYALAILQKGSMPMLVAFGPAERPAAV